MTTECYNIAKHLSSIGWVLHPLSNPAEKADSAGKRPLLPEWQKRTVATDEELHQWFDNTKNNTYAMTTAFST